MQMLPLFFISIFLFISAFAAVPPQMIPRVPTGNYFSQGIFEGGKLKPATLDKVELKRYRTRKMERWILHFKKGKKRITYAPRFQMRFIPGVKSRVGQGKSEFSSPPKLLFLFRRIDNEPLDRKAIATLLKRSSLVKEVIAYPKIENGDMAIELQLKDAFLFHAHQPEKYASRIILDLKKP